jgi:type IV secretion system protein VirD4
MAKQATARLAARIIAGLALMGVAWTLIASLVFLLGTRLIGAFAHPFYQWWSYLLYAPPNPAVTLWLRIGAGVASAAVLLFPATIMIRGRTVVGPSLRHRLFGGMPQPIRGATDNHGHADWLSIAKAREVFPGPSTLFGGIVVGEAYRVDQDRVAALAFDPADKATWGQGGAAPLLVDPCKSGPTHSLVFAGAGSFKSARSGRS